MAHLVSQLLCGCLLGSSVWVGPIKYPLSIKMYQLFQVYITPLIMGKPKPGNTKLSKPQLRAQAVALRKEGKTAQEVATSLGMSVRWVRKWSRRYKEGVGLADQPRSGRPSFLTTRAKDLIRKAKGRRHQSCRRLSRRLQNLGEPSVQEYCPSLSDQKTGLAGI